MADTSFSSTLSASPASHHDGHVDRRRFLRGPAVAAGSVVAGSLLQGLDTRTYATWGPWKRGAL